MRACKDIHMPTIAIISQKGGAGKTTLGLHLAAAAEDSGHTAVVIDVDPQATASQWAAWRQDAPPDVIDSAPPRLAAKSDQATGHGAARSEERRVGKESVGSGRTGWRRYHKNKTKTNNMK